MLLKAESEYHDFHQFFMREGTFALYLKGVAMQIIEDKVYAFSKDNPPSVSYTHLTLPTIRLV